MSFCRSGNIWIPTFERLDGILEFNTALLDEGLSLWSGFYLMHSVITSVRGFINGSSFVVLILRLNIIIHYFPISVVCFIYVRAAKRQSLSLKMTLLY